MRERERHCVKENGRKCTKGGGFEITTERHLNKQKKCKIRI